MFYSGSRITKESNNTVNGRFYMKQKVNRVFQYKGEKRCVPFIYRFWDGIVFDVLTLLDQGRLKAFWDKYESRQEHLTAIERSCAEQENPCKAIEISKIELDGKTLEGEYSFTHRVFVSLPSRKSEVPLALKKAYAGWLEGVDSFTCQRFFIANSKNASKPGGLLRFLGLNKVKMVKLLTRPEHKIYPLNLKVEVPEEGEEKEASFSHPLTGAVHRLYFQNPVSTELSQGANGHPSLYLASGVYQVDPPLPSSDQLQFNQRVQYSMKPEGLYSPTASSQAIIGIIGGADGPTFILHSRNEDSKEDRERAISNVQRPLPYHACLTVPVLNKEDKRFFHIEGLSVETENSQEILAAGSTFK